MNRTIGLISTNYSVPGFGSVTEVRPAASIPFGGRYRLLDFALSNMVISRIQTVGLVTPYFYRSIIDHVGAGKPWDLSRKTEGMFILPPFASAGNKSFYSGRVEALNANMGFIARSTEEYILFADCNNIVNIDIDELMDYHTDKAADITIVYKHGKCPRLQNNMAFSFDDDSRVRMVAMSPASDTIVEYSMNIILMKKSLLQRLVNDAVSMNHESFERDIIQSNVEKLRIYGFEAKGFSLTVDSMQSYFDANMQLLDPDNCKQLFNRERPIYTKVRDDMPAIYGLGSSV